MSMRKPGIIAVIAWVTLTSQTASADVYKWTDAQGRVHYGDKPPENQQPKAVEVKPAPQVEPRAESSSNAPVKSRVIAASDAHQSWSTRLLKAIERDDEPGAIALLSLSGGEQLSTDHVLAAVKAGHENLLAALYIRRAALGPDTFAYPQAYIREALLAGQLPIYRKMKELGFVAQFTDTLLTDCIHQTRYESAEALLADGANPDTDNGELLRLAAQRRDAALTELLLRYGANPNLKPEHLLAESDRREHKFTHPALWKAVGGGAIKVVELLIKAGADPNLADTVEGETPLDVAERRGDLAMADYLVQHGGKNSAKGRQRKQQASQLRSNPH